MYTMAKDLQKLISVKEKELKVLKGMLGNIQNNKTKECDDPFQNTNVAIRYNLKNNSIYAQIGKDEKVHVCYLDTPKNVAIKSLEMFPPNKYGVGAMDCDFTRWLTEDYGKKLCEEIKKEKDRIKQANK